jgi:fatty acid desaturase
MNEEQKTAAIGWYRTPVPAETLKRLHQRDDRRGWAQAAGYLSVLALTGTTAFYAAGRWPWPVVVALVFLHGTVFAFQVNAVHELGHGTVFQTRWLNGAFERIFAFLGWINFQMFDVSHVRHHQYTLHPPDDLEVVLPIRLMVRDFFLRGFVDVKGLGGTLKTIIRVARGKFEGEWETKLFPVSSPAKQRPPIRWARTLLIGHGLIVVVSMGFKLWLVPVLVTLAPFYGGWLFFLCNNTQHIGLQDNVPDFRLCCRTFTLNPAVGFLYWHMNYHTEHHMYAAVPCYRLGQLHRVIQHDLPACPRGLGATWREIAAIQKIQRQNPAYQHVAILPGARPAGIQPLGRAMSCC